MTIDLQLIGLFVFIAFCIVALIQILYYLLLFRKFALYEPPIKQSSIQQPVSIIVCARDEAENLVRNLPGILVQDYKTTNEIIVVNDNSTDESRYIIDEFKKTFKNIINIELTQEAKFISGKKFPLSMGIKSAKYETLILTDADCVPASDQWVQKIQDAYDDGIDIVLGYGAYHKRKGILNKLIRFETFHTALQYFSYALAGMPYMGVGRNLSYKREMFMKNKGFSSINMIPSGDDDLFINKVANKFNTAIMIEPESHTLSEAKDTFASWMNQKSRHYTTSKYYKAKHKFWLSLYAYSFGLFYPACVFAAITFNWWICLIIVAVKWIIQGIILFKTMNKLNEKDLWPYFILFDLWMIIYYSLSFPLLFKKPKKAWN